MPQPLRSQGIPASGQITAGQLPVRGINTRDAAALMGPEDALDLINVLSEDYGMTLRGGYQEFATNLPGSVQVPTLMSFYPGTAGPSEAGGFTAVSFAAQQTLPRPRAINVTLAGQLFACTNGGIVDITAGGAGPWTPLAGVTVTTDYWTWINFQNASGNYLLACNNDGGYYVYGGANFDDGFSDGFSVNAVGFSHVVEGTQPGQIEGIDPDLFVYIMVWKRRIWFIEKDSSRAWYLPVDQITGKVTLFDFGTQFRRGGFLAQLGNWTIDGGAGIDDHLAAFSSEGDVVIFTGYDPDSAATDPAAFALRGIWFVGALPEGRRQVSTYGGDLYVLSIFGITQLSKLVAEAQVAANLIEDSSARIDPYITQLMKNSHAREGWYLLFLPRDQLLVVGVPEQLINEGNGQLVMKTRRLAWSKMLDIPVATMMQHDSLTFGGGKVATPTSGGGKVFLMFDNSLDNVPLAGSAGSLIRGRIIPSYSHFGSPGMLKSFPMIRPIVSAQQTPVVQLTILTDFAGSSFFSVPTLPVLDASLWDVDLWDVGKWGGFLKPIRKWLGTVGAGYSATVQIDFVGLGGTRVMAIDWYIKAGGPL